MARGASRPERRPGRQSREPVPALDDIVPFFGDDPDDDDPFGGSAGVREPRRPVPPGPNSGAGAKPMPESEFGAVLAVTEPLVGACRS